MGLRSCHHAVSFRDDAQRTFVAQMRLVRVASHCAASMAGNAARLAGRLAPRRGKVWTAFAKSDHDRRKPWNPDIIGIHEKLVLGGRKFHQRAMGQKLRRLPVLSRIDEHLIARAPDENGQAHRAQEFRLHDASHER